MATQFSQTTKSLAQDTSRYAYIAWLLSGALLTGWALWFFFGSVTVYEISKRARLEVLQAPHRVAAPIARSVMTTALAIGQEVQAGDILAELDSRSEKLRLAEEETRLAAIPLRIASLKREIVAQEAVKAGDLQSAAAAEDVAKFRNQETDAALTFAKDYEKRFTGLGARGVVATVDVTRAVSETQKLTAARSAASSDLKRIGLDAQARAYQHDAQIESLRNAIVALEGDMATTHVTIARLKMDIEKQVVRAPIAGRIGDVFPLHTGEYVAEGQWLATIVPAGDLIIVADFSPSLTLGRVKAGQHARLRLDGFPWAEYGTIEARVSRVSSEIRDNMVRVEFAIDSAPADGAVMQHGLPGSIEVNVEQASAAALVLRSAGLLLSTPKRQDMAVAQLAR